MTSQLKRKKEKKEQYVERFSWTVKKERRRSSMLRGSVGRLKKDKKKQYVEMFSWVVF